MIDCRGFARDAAYYIAKAAGLKTPLKGFKSPAEWLADLVDDN